MRSFDKYHRADRREDHDDDACAKEDVRSGYRRAYAPPMLRSFGCLLDRTGAGGSEVVDSGSLGQNRFAP